MANHLREIIHPGPIDTSVLTLQDLHRSTHIWKNELYVTLLRCRRRFRRNQNAVDERLVPFIRQAGFFGVHKLSYVQLDWALITALVERWRQETHTFHLPSGEATITLQDVEVILGLPVDGLPVTGAGYGNWTAICQELLGATPDDDQLRSSRLHMAWLSSTFDQLPADADDEKILCYARAHILQLIGGVIFPDKSQNLVKLMYLPLLRDLQQTSQLSWGSAALGCLYRELCRATRPDASDIAGPLLLLQIWAWERLPIIRPERLRPQHQQDGPLGCRWVTEYSTNLISTHTLAPYRDQLDMMPAQQIIWEPYTEDILARLPAYCIAGRDIWRANVPLVCFDVVEWHLPGRVLRQFGLKQTIPSPCDTGIQLHKVDRRGKSAVDWQSHHQSFLDLWARRREFIAEGEPSKGPMSDDDPYMHWYYRITRRFIGPVNNLQQPGYHSSVRVVKLLMQSMTDIYHACQRGADAIPEIANMCRQSMDAVHTHYHLQVVDIPLTPEASQVRPPKGSRRKSKQSTSTVDPQPTSSAAIDCLGASALEREPHGASMYMDVVLEQTKVEAIPAAPESSRIRPPKGSGKRSKKSRSTVDPQPISTTVTNDCPDPSASESERHGASTSLDVANDKNHPKVLDIPAAPEPSRVRPLKGSGKNSKKSRSTVDSRPISTNVTNDCLDPSASDSVPHGASLAMHIVHEQYHPKVLDLPTAPEPSGVRPPKGSGKRSKESRSTIDPQPTSASVANDSQDPSASESESHGASKSMDVVHEHLKALDIPTAPEPSPVRPPRGSGKRPKKSRTSDNPQPSSTGAANDCTDQSVSDSESHGALTSTDMPPCSSTGHVYIKQDTDQPTATVPDISLTLT